MNRVPVSNLRAGREVDSIYILKRKLLKKKA